MGVPYKEALSNLQGAAKQVFAADTRVHAIGITRHGADYGYRVVRNIHKLVAFVGASNPPGQFHTIPIVYANAPHDAHSLVKVPSSGPASPGP